MKWGENDLSKRRDAREKAALDKQRWLARLKTARPDVGAPLPIEAAPSRFATVDRQNLDRAALRLRFRRLTDDEAAARVGPPSPLNEPTQQLLSALFDALLEHRTTVLLQWPAGQRDVLLLHPLAMLSLVCSSPDRLAGGQSWCDPVPDFRTLYFPWRGGSTGAVQRSVLIDRAEFLRRNMRHLTRQVLHEPEHSEAMGKLHETLGHLSNLSKRDGSQPHLAYPTLAEIYPVFVADGGDDAPAPFRKAVGELYGRVRHGAAIDRLSDHRPMLSDPIRAPFALLGVTARADPQRVAGLSAAQSADVCLLDLGPPALSRLGHGWEELLETFVNAIRARHPSLPFVAVTQDAYVHRQVSHLLAPKPPTEGLGVSSRVMLRTTDDPLQAEALRPGDLSALSATIDCAGGAPAAALAALSSAARGASDATTAGRIRRAMGGLRRAASMPCGLAQAYNWLCEMDGQGSAEIFLERRSCATVLAPILEALQGPAAGAERARFTDAAASVRAAFDALDGETPTGSLLLERAAILARKSSPSLMVFGTDAERKLAERRLVTDADVGERLTKKIAGGRLRLVTADELEVALTDIEGTRDRNSWKRLALIAPALDHLAMLLVRPWLPDELLILCDHGFTGRMATAFGQLAKHPDIQTNGSLLQRLQAVAREAKRESEARAVGPVDLSVESGPVIPTTDDVIDLIDDDEGGRGVVILSLQSGRSLRIRPGSVVVKHRRDAEANAFDRDTARDVREGDVIVVPDRAFVDEARRVLPVQVLALNRVAHFHAIVEAALPDIPGDIMAAKARAVGEGMRRIGAKAVGQAAISDWLNAAEHQKVAPEERRPHAPQSRAEFFAFMTVLGAEPLGEKIWNEGVQQMRVARQQAGLRMAQAFISVLVDPHGAALGFDHDVRGQITLLRRRALDHLDTVVAVSLNDKMVSA